MPISKYFGGHGTSVMQDMVSKHGAKKGKQEFYATANKMKSKLAGHMMQGRFKKRSYA